jgi:HEAT repeat protein
VRRQTWLAIGALKPTDGESLHTLSRLLTRPAESDWLMGEAFGELRDYRWGTDRRWIGALLVQAGKPAVAPLTACLSREDLSPPAHMAAQRVLREIGPNASEAIPALIAAERRAALQSSPERPWKNPTSASLTLGLIDKKESLRQLQPLLRDPDRRVQGHAAEIFASLEKFGG